MKPEKMWLVLIGVRGLWSHRTKLRRDPEGHFIGPLQGRPDTGLSDKRLSILTTLEITQG